jgi:phosphoglycerol transferase MdoB-like AlkP superfamily enzyme
MWRNKSFFPQSIAFALKLMSLLFILFFAYRLFFFYWYKPAEKALSGSMLFMGARFDARICAIIAVLATILFLLLINKKWQFPKILSAITAIVFSFIALTLITDFFYFDYLQQRLSAGILNFAADASISAKMVMETYPVFSGGFGILLVAILFYFLFLKKFIRKRENDTVKNKKTLIISSIVFFIFCAVCIFGKIGQYPLRWSDAFSLSDEFKAQTALNPFQSFASSLKFRKEGFNKKEAIAAYPLVANFFSLTANSEMNLLRNANQQPTANKPNIIVVICESFSAYKSSMYGNPLNTTPYFNSLTKQGLFYSNCYTPSYGTARGVWATLTGVPDVAKSSTASRNPAMVNQHCIMNDFNGFEKMYFLGGSTTWANIRGVLTNNIDGLKIYEQENFKAKQVDVWGVSDKNLFLEASAIFAQQQKPFVSIIQTADNHRPYTIPKEDAASFKTLTYPTDSLTKYGFESNAQMNAFRYSDYCFETFINAAKKEKYFNNTIFIFVGDHGLRGDAKNMFPSAYTTTGIAAEHVPLLFYAPKLLQPQKINTPVSQLDVFPTAAGLANINYSNTGYGRDLLKDSLKPYAFINDPDEQTISLVGNEYIWQKQLATGKEIFENISNNAAGKNIDSAKGYMKQTTEALYNFAHYLLLNNKKIK